MDYQTIEAGVYVRFVVFKVASENRKTRTLSIDVVAPIPIKGDFSVRPLTKAGLQHLGRGRYVG
jgi:hypothetical protein